jgi:hypothetical protein
MQKYDPFLRKYRNPEENNRLPRVGKKTITREIQVKKLVDLGGYLRGNLRGRV